MIIDSTDSYYSNFNFTLKRHLRNILKEEYREIHERFTEKLVDRMMGFLRNSPDITKTPIIDFTREDIYLSDVNSGKYVSRQSEIPQKDLFLAIVSCEYYGGVFSAQLESSRVPMSIYDMGYKLAHFYDKASTNDSTYSAAPKYANDILEALRYTARDTDIREYARILKDGNLSEDEIRRSNFFNELNLDFK